MESAFEVAHVNIVVLGCFALCDPPLRGVFSRLGRRGEDKISKASQYDRSRDCTQFLGRREPFGGGI